MYLLSSKEEIRAALATMNGTARDACMLFATHLLNDPSIANDPDKLGQFCAGSIAVTLEQAGYSPDRFLPFMENHGEAVYNVGVSILVLTAQEAENQKKWGWLGTAAAVGVGALLGSFFG